MAEGIAVGKARLVDTARFPSQVPRYSIGEHEMEGELKRLRVACAETRDELEELAATVEQRVGKREADLIRPQALMVQDPAFISEVEELIIEERVNVEAAVAQVMEQFEELIASVDDRYLAERSIDVRDAARRILANLLFIEHEIAPDLSEPSVVVADHLLPSLTVHLERDKVLAFASEKGGRTSHGAILARSLGIPAVTGLEGLTEQLAGGETVLVDGTQGVVIVNPSRSRLARYKKLADRYEDDRRKLIAEAGRPALSLDGVDVVVRANIGRPEEVQHVIEYGAAGVGLYRTEFDFLSEAWLPSEEALADQYGEVAEALGDRGLTLRVLDIGGDKFPASVPLQHEENPFMGLRGLRLLLRRADDLLLPQLRAIVRAADKGRVSVLYPMVASIEDLEAAKRYFRQAVDQVATQGVASSAQIPQGVMIEVPSCIPLLPELLDRSEFASVGTNDLVQYLLAADRNSDRMVDVYDPFHPAVMRTLDAIRRAGEQKGKEVSVCGEIAGDPPFLAILLGLGFRSVSVNVGVVPYIKQAVRDLDVGACETLARKVLRASTASEVHQAIEEFHRRSHRH